ncbi:hypothetical protein [Helicobacter sp. 23-1045]
MLNMGGGKNSFNIHKNILKKSHKTQNLQKKFGLYTKKIILNLKFWLHFFALRFCENRPILARSGEKLQEVARLRATLW